MRSEKKIPLIEKVMAYFDDNDSQVRFVIAKNVIDLQWAMGYDFACERLMPAFGKLLTDTDANVSLAAKSIRQKFVDNFDIHCEFNNLPYKHLPLNF